jgi:hypothetical protein
MGRTRTLPPVGSGTGPDARHYSLLAIRLTWEQALHTRAEDVGPAMGHSGPCIEPLRVRTSRFDRRCLAKSSRTGVGPPPRHIASAGGRRSRAHIKPVSCSAACILHGRSLRAAEACAWIIEPEFKPTEQLAFQSSISETTVNAEDVEGLHIHGRLQRAIFRFSRAAVSEALLMSRPWASSGWVHSSIPRSSTIAVSSAAGTQIDARPLKRGRG